jgi:hypothetical protein
MTIPAHTMSDYSGCGAYLVAYHSDGIEGFAYDNIIEIKKISYPILPQKPVAEKNLRKDSEKLRFALLLEQYYSARDLAIMLWRDDLRRFNLDAIVEVCDLSCTEIVWRHTDLAWIAHDGLLGTGIAFDCFLNGGGGEIKSLRTGLQAKISRLNGKFQA